METMYYKSKVDWWIPVLVIFSVGFCFIGAMIDGGWLFGAILAIIVLAVEVLIFAGVKYQIREGMLGVRNFFYWTWYPISGICEVRASHSILSAAALSFDRLAIKFSDRSILKSFMPLEISPADKEGFITKIKEINPEIKVIA